MDAAARAAGKKRSRLATNPGTLRVRKITSDRPFAPTRGTVSCILTQRARGRKRRNYRAVGSALYKKFSSQLTLHRRASAAHRPGRCRAADAPAAPRGRPGPRRRPGRRRGRRRDGRARSCTRGAKTRSVSRPETTRPRRAGSRWGRRRHLRTAKEQLSTATYRAKWRSSMGSEAHLIIMRKRLIMFNIFLLPVFLNT